MRQVQVFMYDSLAGVLTQDDTGYHFQYTEEYLKKDSAKPISKTLPVTEQKYSSFSLFAFFDGLIPEGWLLDIAEKNWKLNPRDRMGLLLKLCTDCIGAVSIKEFNEE